MVIDYLRYVAFNGRLREFFQGAASEYAEPGAITGLHLRYEPKDLALRFNGHVHRWADDGFWRGLSGPARIEYIVEQLGLSTDLDALVPASSAKAGERQTFEYHEKNPPRLQVIVDIDPAAWSDRYSESRSLRDRVFEDTAIVYRRSGPGQAHLGSGDRVRDASRAPKKFGTLCGIFETEHGATYGLTCGHVVGPDAAVLGEGPRRLWRFPLSTRSFKLGETEHHRRCAPAAAGVTNTAQPLDAALVVLSRLPRRMPRPPGPEFTAFRPISTLMQEEPVHFTGARSGADMHGRIAAVTVRKAMDLYRDGSLYDVGDVLMLGHRFPQYVRQPVTRPGDSGAAVRGSMRPHEATAPWCGMVLGSDENGGYATHAEHLWAWAAQELNDPAVTFRYQA